MHLLKFIPLLIIASSTHAQTCIVLRKTKTEIVVGADSKTRKYVKKNNGLGYDTLFRSMCKILNYKNVGFAVSGVNIEGLIDVVKLAIDEGGSIGTIAKSCGQILNDEWPKFLKSEYERNPNLYVKLFNDSSYISGIMLFGVESDSLASYQVRSLMIDKMKAYTDVYVDTVFSGQTIAHGHTAEIQKLLNIKSTWSKGTISGINTLISIEANAVPLVVGGKITMARFTKKKGFEWISKCE